MKDLLLTYGAFVRSVNDHLVSSDDSSKMENVLPQNKASDETQNQLTKDLEATAPHFSVKCK